MYAEFRMNNLGWKIHLTCLMKMKSDGKARRREKAWE